MTLDNDGQPKFPAGNFLPGWFLRSGEKVKTQTVFLTEGAQFSKAQKVRGGVRVVPQPTKPLVELRSWKPSSMYVNNFQRVSPWG